MNGQNRLHKLQHHSLFPIVIIFLIVVAVNAYLQPGFFTFDVFQSNLASFTPLVLASMAQAVVILVGGIDLSLGMAITLSTVIMAATMNDSPSSVILGIGLSLVATFAVGALNGITVGYLKLPAIISTFAVSAICYGAALLIMPQPGGYIPSFFYETYQTNIASFLPMSLVIIIIGLVIWGFIQRRKIYRYIYAVGGSEQAAYANGINTKKVKLYAFLISSVFIVLTALVVVSQTATGDANMGRAYTLNSIAAVVIGGISLQGGKGNLIGAVLGALILGFISNIIFFANLSSFYQDLIKGLIIIFALTLSILPTLRKKALA
ncbi:ABC transporter permease [Cohnella cholangitidis]|uniref:Autoinducer 2 import system permease protein LsrD n=1 Tax=Cohnella cholangitidis TaxID=2598458 RepID=A0A7G5C280_9BACL|nr:ABC transporter permease [Cohnella cholangitidis]QMV43314.1 ABC transporter permease [Cohnella cholangitidis]